MTDSVKRADSATTDIIVKSHPSTCYEDLQKENASVLEEILALGNEVTKGDLQDLHLNGFFHMYNEVFPAAAQSKSSEMKLSGKRSETGVNNPTVVVDKCIRKLREVHRRKFRGVFYQTGSRLQEINVTATAEAMKLFNKLAEKAFPTASERDESKSALKDRILLERRWLEKVNDWKRQKHFDQIKIEAFESFKSAVENEFPFVDLEHLHDNKEMVVYDDNNNEDKIVTMQFYWRQEKLKAQLEQSMNAVVFDFKQQIPSEEDPELVKALEQSLRNALLDGSISPILDKNSENQIRAQAVMYALVEELTVDFKDKMISLVQESPLLDPPLFRSHHQEIVTEYMQSIEVKAAEFAGPSEFHVHFQNALNTKIDEIFKLVMGVAIKEAQVSVETCSNRSKECVRKCAQKVEAIFEEFGAASIHSSGLRDKLEACLMQAIDVVRGNTIVNVRNVEKLVESTMSKKIYTNAEKAEKLTAISESVKALYRERVEELLKLRQNSPLQKSFDFQGFQKTEDNIRNDISKLLRDEIRSQVGDDVDLDLHLNKLHQYISDYWTNLQTIVETLENATKHLPKPKQVNKEVPKNNKNKIVSKKPSKGTSSSKVVAEAPKIKEVKKVISKNVIKPNNKPGKDKVIQGQSKKPSTSTSVKEVNKMQDSEDRRQPETTLQKQPQNMSESELIVTWSRSHRETSSEKEELSPVVFQSPAPQNPVTNLIIIKNPTTGDEYFIEPHLEIDHKRVATQRVGVHLYYEINENCAPDLPEKYKWDPVNLDEEKGDQIGSFLDQVQSLQQLSSTGRSRKGKLSKTAKLTRAKKALTLMSNEMLHLLENASHIKTELGRDLILKRIEEAVIFAELTDSTLEEVKKQMEALGGIYSKYFHMRDMEKSPATLTPPPELTDSEGSKDVDVIVAAGVSVNNNESETITELKLKTDMPFLETKTRPRKKRGRCSCLRRLFNKKSMAKLIGN